MPSSRPQEQLCVGGPSVRSNRVLKLLIFILILLLTSAAVQAEEPNDSEKAESGNLPEEAAQYIRLSIPPGFLPHRVDEKGIYRWRKDSGEIYLVLGEPFAESGELLYKELREAAKKDKQFESVKAWTVKGGRALLIKDKPPKDPERLQTWRLTVVTDDKIMNVDFTAPAKDFKSFVPAFKKVLGSFRLPKRS